MYGSLCIELYNMINMYFFLFKQRKKHFCMTIKQILNCMKFNFQVCLIKKKNMKSYPSAVKLELLQHGSPPHIFSINILLTPVTEA